MTNTLHRYGDAESFRDDYVVFAICSRGTVPRLAGRTRWAGRGYQTEGGAA